VRAADGRRFPGTYADRHARAARAKSLGRDGKIRPGCMSAEIIAERNASIRALYAGGMSLTRIARRVDVCRDTARL
jgi:hypothetical protein